MIKHYIENKKKKQKEYWDNLDVDRQLKIEQIKTERSKQDLNSSKSLLKFFIALLIPLLVMPIYVLTMSIGTHYFNYEHYEQLQTVGE